MIKNEPRFIKGVQHGGGQGVQGGGGDKVPGELFIVSGDLYAQLHNNMKCLLIVWECSFQGDHHRGLPDQLHLPCPNIWSSWGGLSPSELHLEQLLIWNNFCMYLFAKNHFSTLTICVHLKHQWSNFSPGTAFHLDHLKSSTCPSGEPRGVCTCCRRSLQRSSQAAMHHCWGSGLKKKRKNGVPVVFCFCR